MKKYLEIINTINICKKHKKFFFKKKLNKNELNLIKSLLRLNVISFLKKIVFGFYIIYINEKSKLQIHTVSKINKITINKKLNIKNKKQVLIVSNSSGFTLNKINKFGVIFAKITI